MISSIFQSVCKHIKVTYLLLDIGTALRTLIAVQKPSKITLLCIDGSPNQDVVSPAACDKQCQHRYTDSDTPVIPRSMK